MAQMLFSRGRVGPDTEPQDTFTRHTSIVLHSVVTDSRQAWESGFQ